jgi:hypothetical protein
VDGLAVGGHDVYRADARAGGAVHAAVPAESALEEISAYGHPRAVPGGEEQPLRFELGGQHAAVLAGPDDRDLVVGVDGTVVDPADVEQQSAIAQMVRLPATPTGTHGDAVTMGVGVADGGDHIVDVVGLHDHIGIARRYPAVPHRRSSS